MIHFKKLQKRLRDEKLVIVKSDKGNSLIVMDHEAYRDKVKKFLLDSNAVPISSYKGLFPNTNHAYPHYASLEDRIDSFKNWNEAVSVNSLSLAGFFYSGSFDRTYCFHCGGCLQSWEIKDDPVRVHKRWFPKYKFLAKQITHHTVNKFNSKIRSVISSSIHVIPVGKMESLHQMCYATPPPAIWATKTP